MNNDVNGIFESYISLLQEQNNNLGTLIGAQGGGEGGNWGGSLPKLVSILPMGNWKPTSLKRERVGTKSGFTSDHYVGNNIAYAADFGLNSTFNGSVEQATNFAIKVAQKVDPSVTSWQPFKGGSFKKITNDGYRIQIIWLSNVGGNHYDHVHVGVKKTTSSDLKYPQQQDEVQDQIQQQTQDGSSKEENPEVAKIKGMSSSLATDFSRENAKTAMQNILGGAWSAVAKASGKK